MSHSPPEAEGRTAVEEFGQGSAAQDYLAAWGAINRLIREGYSWSGHERNVLLLSQAGERFVDASAWSGFDWPDDARALVRLDWDFDGDLDLALTNRTGPRLRLVENRWTPAPRFVALAPRGTRTNPDGIGARVELELADGPAPRLAAVRRAGEGFLSQQGAWLHFGLGSGRITRVLVEWPGGAIEEFAGVEAAGFFELVEGAGLARRFTPPVSAEGDGWGRGDTEAESEAAGDGATDGTSRVVLAAPVPMPTLRLGRADGQPGMLFGIKPGGLGSGIGSPVVVSLFASWCAPCATELAAIEARKDAWDEAGIVRVALSADEPEAYEAARELIGRVGWSGTFGFASPESLGVLDALHGALLDIELRLPLPSTFLVDGAGRLVALYRGVVSPAQLLEDLDLARSDDELEEQGEARRDRAVPFPGRWHGPPPEPDYAYLERFSLKRGLPLAAREFHAARFDVSQASAAEVHYRMGRARAVQRDYAAAIESFEGAVEADPYFFAAWRDLGLALHLSDRFEPALEAYDRALVLTPGHVDTLFDRALAHLAVGQGERASHAVDLIRAQDPERATELERRIADYRGDSAPAPDGEAGEPR